MNKEKGYISLWRCIQDNALWGAEPFTRAQAWIDLLLMANYQEKTFVLGNEILKAEVGSVITSELKLMERWKWGKEKVRNFLKLLESLEMIKRIPDHKKTYILICNYEEAQKIQTDFQTATSPDFTKDSEEPQTDFQTVSRLSADHEQTVNRTQTININNYKITKNNNRECVRHKYGEYKNVLLSDEELQKLKGEFNERVVMDKIEALSSYMKSTGKGYKSHIATLRNWIRKDEGGVKNESTGEKCEIYKGFML